FQTERNNVTTAFQPPTIQLTKVAPPEHKGTPRYSLETYHHPQPFYTLVPSSPGQTWLCIGYHGTLNPVIGLNRTADANAVPCWSFPILFAI
ncbi:hypothetical protein, partial [Litorimonas sp.]|uniref:hypothetical protein n=1 Tax=Litorimonas sp. TaxID=1892381 RepID=UPI003A8B87F6